MKNCYALFRSKTQANIFRDVLNSKGVICRIVSTPKEARLGCGYSVVFQLVALNEAKKIISSRRFDAFNGFIIIEKNGLRTSSVRI